MQSEQYATANDGTPLFWTISLAPGSSGENPKVLLIHGGGFKTEGENVLKICSPSLNAAGYDCYAPQYRLAPPGRVPGQTSSGRFPDQTNDIMLAAAAAAEIPGCKLFALGGSTGGSHAIWLAALFDGLTAAVAISPATQLDDPVSLKNSGFNHDVTNYAPDDPAGASPDGKLTAASKPIFLTAFAQDHMPAPQYSLCLSRLSNLNIPHQAVLLPGNGHSYPDAWPLIHGQAIDFLNSYL